MQLFPCTRQHDLDIRLKHRRLDRVVLVAQHFQRDTRVHRQIRFAHKRRARGVGADQIGIAAHQMRLYQIKQHIQLLHTLRRVVPVDAVGKSDPEIALAQHLRLSVDADRQRPLAHIDQFDLHMKMGRPVTPVPPVVDLDIVVDIIALH